MTSDVQVLDESARPGERYAIELEAHRRIEALYPRVEAMKVRFRKPQRVGRSIPLPPRTQSIVDIDRVVCALTNKAATTKQSVVRLCEAGDGQGAFVLTRVLMENAVLLEWLIRGPERVRLETYVLFISVLRQRGAEKLEHFYKRFADREVSHISDPYDDAIAEHVFQGKHDTWAYFPSAKKKGLDRVQIRRMFEEVTENERPLEYEVWYSMASDEVHSSPLSLSHILGRLESRDMFVLQPGLAPSNETCLMALGISNLSMFLVLDTLDEFTGLGLTADLTTIKDWLRQSQNSSKEDA